MKNLVPGAACSFERQGTVGTIDKQRGGIKTSQRVGTVVTCPVLKTAQYLGAGNAQLVTATVHYWVENSNVPMRCALRWTTVGTERIEVNDSEVSSTHSGDDGRIRVQHSAVPLKSFTVLRCQIPEGVTLVGYRVEING